MSIFARRHYQAIAEVLTNCYWSAANPREVINTVEAIASMLARDNPNFNRDRFLKACGMEK